MCILDREVVMTIRKISWILFAAVLAGCTIENMVEEESTLTPTSEETTNPDVESDTNVTSENSETKDAEEDEQTHEWGQRFVEEENIPYEYSLLAATEAMDGWNSYVAEDETTSEYLYEGESEYTTNKVKIEFLRSPLSYHQIMELGYDDSIYETYVDVDGSYLSYYPELELWGYSSSEEVEEMGVDSQDYEPDLAKTVAGGLREAYNVSTAVSPNSLGDNSYEYHVIVSQEKGQTVDELIQVGQYFFDTTYSDEISSIFITAYVIEGNITSVETFIEFINMDGEIYSTSSLYFFYDVDIFDEIDIPEGLKEEAIENEQYIPYG